MTIAPRAQRRVLCRELTQEHKYSAHPLQGADRVGEEDHRGQNGEELSSCGDDGAGQGAKIHNRHEDKALERPRKWGQAGSWGCAPRSKVCDRTSGLVLLPSSPSQVSPLGGSQATRSRGTHLPQGTGQAKEKDVIDDGGVPFGKAQELPELPSEQDSCGEMAKEERHTLCARVGACVCTQPGKVLHGLWENAGTEFTLSRQAPCS